MTRHSYTFGRVAAAIAAVALAGSSALGGGIVTEDVSMPITNEPDSTATFLSLTFFITEGGVFPPENSEVIFLDTPFPSVEFEGGAPRATESITIFEDDQALEYLFPLDDLWVPGQSLVFNFRLQYPEGKDFDLDLQFQKIPAPGPSALALAALGAVAHRRRR